MSCPSSPIDDGTPMNVNPHVPPPPHPPLYAQSHQPDIFNGQPPAQARPRHHISPVNDDSNPDNDDNDHQPQSSPPSRPDHAHSSPADSPPSPMQQGAAADASASAVDSYGTSNRRPAAAGGDSAATVSGAAAATAGGTSAVNVTPQGSNHCAEAIDDDSPDALPKIFRPTAGSVSPEAKNAGKGIVQASVVAWSATDVYALPPAYPSMGTFVIISNKSFEARTGMGVRNGTDVDAQNLYLRFKEFGFDVRIHRDVKAKDIISLFQDIGRMDHSSSAAFGCAILTHGEDGVIYGTDRQVEIDNITQPFKGDKCKSLIGKPKLFFIQACRGSELMDGVPVDAHQSDAQTDITERLPVESDILMAYSVVPGYFSWRNSIRGSWFIQALCDCLDKYGKSMDLLRLLTRVNKKVALDFESNTNNKEMHKKKQIPCITSMLTKDFYLDSKAVPRDNSP